ncbi:DUF4825 domain-containing protein [Psychrobacillus sp. FJAT-21963]|uniref:DUF4825 domain-containing protein n=1 Tax=Psychrobacillus sp. FJAT-21963 TaxID=1712028 RepID=UPI0006F6B855|nr:DUF4825 domain-containing protein [Psychrobacillus sp. FJAT-21963]KQL34628.1 hypothetical protein AN959_12920 [Psychrobacillus sp. FJAT-21963]
MQKNTWLIIIMAMLLLIGVVYVLNNNQKNVIEDKTSQLSVATHSFEKVLAYENDYMGDAANTSNLFNNLPLANDKKSIEMDSEKLILVVNYDSLSSEETEKAVIYNTTAAFVLIKNIEEINLQYSDRTYVVKKANVKEWFGNDFSQLINPEVFKKLVQNPLLEKDSGAWLNLYTKQGE